MNSGIIAGLVSAPLKTKGVNYIQNAVTLTSPLTWAVGGSLSGNTVGAIVGLKPITQIIGTTFSNLTISIPAITKASTANKGIYITAGTNFDTSADAYGGNIVIQAGKAYRAGIVRIVGGEGPYTGSPAQGAVIQLNGGNVVGGSGGSGGHLYLSGGTCQNQVGASGGDVIITSGIGIPANQTSYPGNIYISSGVGNVANNVNDNQTNGGIVRITTGNGGNTVNPTTNGGGSTGSHGGSFILSGGFGGNSIGVVSTAQTGGSGASISIFSGNGGTAIVATSSGTRIGGNSGPISIITGAGGSGITINGNSSSLILGTGLAGAGIGTPGVVGSIRLNPGSTNVLTISATAIRATQTLNLENGTTSNSMYVYNTYTDATTYERGYLNWSSTTFQIGTDKGSVGGVARSIDLQTDGTTRMSVAATGNVGINTTTPNERLTVAGNISASGIIYGDGSGLTNVGVTLGKIVALFTGQPTF